ncbi:TIGR00375 family protein [Methanosarcinales archaeon]|nr:MAG: TIGR00375 family protein [Methanosarcinales archaeon]
MIVNCDLHIHSKYSGATSQFMEFEKIAREAKKKGIQLMGSGDCLHPEWLKEAKEYQREDDVFLVGATHFVLTVEVEDKHRVHHMLIVPDFSKAEELYERFYHFSNDIDSDGRPKLILSGEEIAEIALEADCLIGPCHAFTPWTSMYAYFDSIHDCYGSMTKNVSFLELGLSADSDYGDMLSELHDITFLTNSDAHSPWLDKLAREFNRFELGDISFEELKMGILRKKGRKCVLNVGFFPEEGKYNESACIRCYTHYTLEDAIARKWRCECGGVIKKGVKDRVRELADLDKPIHPPHRPPYLHIVPLAEVIRLAFNQSGTHTKSVREEWNKLITHFGSEIAVLIDEPLNRVEEVADERVTRAIKFFRKGELIIEPGGGGRYGVVRLPNNPRNSAQSSVFDFD